MSILDIFFLAMSLAMDCFTVSIVCGGLLGAWRNSIILRTAFFFGLFQAVMPVLGWGIMFFLALRTEIVGHWIAFAILFLLGGKMVWQALSGKDDATHVVRPDKLSTQLVLAVATSIDALAVGATMALTGYSTLCSLFIPVLLIGVVALVMTLLGYWLGICYGGKLFEKFNPEFMGGSLLILIAFKILLF